MKIVSGLFDKNEGFMVEGYIFFMVRMDSQYLIKGKESVSVETEGCGHGLHIPRKAFLELVKHPS